MTSEQRTELRDDLTNAADLLDEAITAFRALARAVDKAGDSRLAEEIRSYTIGNLAAFAERDDLRHMGSIASIDDGLREDSDEDAA